MSGIAYERVKLVTVRDQPGLIILRTFSKALPSFTVIAVMQMILLS